MALAAGARLGSYEILAAVGAGGMGEVYRATDTNLKRQVAIKVLPAVVDARKARVIELRFFGGLSVEETAEVLHLSTDTIKRDWRLAKLWLLRALEGDSVERR